MQPNYQIYANGVDVTASIRNRFIDLTWHDERGSGSDTLTLSIDDRPDRNGAYIDMPRKGVELTLSLGSGDQLTQVGKFIVDECNPSGLPEKLTIKAHAADMKASLKTKKSRGFDHINLQDLVTTIATEHGLTAKVSPSLSAQIIPRIDQTDENDMHLLQRMAKERGAVAKIAYGYLLFTTKGEAKSVSGRVLPVVQLNKQDLIRWSGVFADREQYQQVTARYYDKATAMEHYVHIGSGFPVFSISRIFTDAVSASHAAQARFDHQKEGSATLDIKVLGQVNMVAEAEVQIAGMRQGIPTTWVCDHAEHTLTKQNGWTVDMKLKKKK